MATVKTKLLENLHQKLLFKPRNFMISRFGLMIGAFSFIFITLLILFTTKLTTPSIFYPSLASSSVKSQTLLSNFTVGGNFSGEGKNVNTHVVNIEFGMKNVSFIGQELRNVSGNFTGEGNFSEGKKTHVVNFEFGVKNVSFIGQELGNISGNFTKESNFSEGKKTHAVNFEFGVKNVSFINSSVGNFSEEGKKFELGVKNVSFIGKNLRNNVKLNFNECDIFDGKWVKDELLPHYPPGSCILIDTDFNCHKNGRPDQGFYKWRWQPNLCDIPRLNATDFLERMRGRRLVFVGDSLNRNMWESLVCILRHSVKNKTRVHEISGRSEFKKQGFYAFRFEDYNCTIDYVRAPFLVRESTFWGQNGSFPTLRLDLMDETTKMYHDADILIFNTGHWWTHEKTSRGEDYYQVGNHVYPRLEALQAYKKALRTWGRWVDKHVNVTKTLVFFRGYSGTHFRGGQWNSGGQCHKETEPIFNETYLGQYPPKMRVLEQVMRKMQTPVMYLNVSRLTDYRKDAHPSIYRKSYETAKELTEAENSQDCSHWCLPSVPDIWNELLYASFLKLRWKHRFHMYEGRYIHKSRN